MENIGPKERHRRLVTGVVLLAGGALAAAALMVTGTDRWWRAALFLPFWLGALGIFQVREKT